MWPSMYSDRDCYRSFIHSSISLNVTSIYQLSKHQFGFDMQKFLNFNHFINQFILLHIIYVLFKRNERIQHLLTYYNDY